jgi:UDP-glucuronate 4-epimerase
LNNRYTLIKGEIRDLQLLDTIFTSNQIDAVIHLASMAGVRHSIQDPLLYYDVNVKGTINLLEMCKKYHVKKFIGASSSSVYGNSKKIPFDESERVDFVISPYAATKKSCEVIGHVYYELNQIDMMILRFFTIYGPRQRPDLAIHKFTRLIVNHKNVPLYGDGSTERDYTYIDDVIEGILKSLDYLMSHHKIYEILNLGNSKTISISKIVNLIEEEIGIKANIIQLPRQPGDVDITLANISKANKLIGYSPRIEFQTGIKKFIEWYKVENKIK